MRRAALALVSLLMLAAVPACSKCDVPTYYGWASGPMSCKNGVR